MIDQTVFKAYDIRGIHPTQINEENYPDIIKAIYTFFVIDLKKDSLTVLLTRDMRVSGPSLYEIAKNELVKLGATVVDAGLASTPTFYYGALKYGYDVGIHISASHNPKEYTGIKFAKRDGNTLIKIGKSSGMTQIKELAVSKQFVSYKDGGRVITNDHILEDEVVSAIQDTGAENVKKFKIVVDPANAMGCIFIPKLFEKIPAEVVMMNDTLDGTFPVHQPDPLDFNNLKGLQERVLSEKADLGISPDGDGDRVFFIDEKGQVIKATSITSLIAHFILKHKPGETIIADIRDIRNVQEICRQLGGKFSMSIVGHAYISAQLNQEQAAFAGESSGHFFFRETGGAESSIRIILYVLRAMSEENKPLSEIVKEYLTSYESPEVNFIVAAPASTDAILEQMKKDYADAEVSTADGVSLQYTDWRCNMRVSNTENEPILRLNVEGANKELVESKLADLEAKIIAQGGKRKSH